jgi:hypothetical protein
MANLTADIPVVRYGVPGNETQPLNFSLKAATTVYRGSIALTRSGVAVPAQNANLAVATDICWGLYDSAGPGTADTGPGVTGGTTDGSVTVEVATGTFFLASSTGADQLGPTTLGKTVYVYDEQTVAATQSSTRPIAGMHVYTDSTRTDAPGIYAIKLGPIAGSSGSP